MFFDGQYPDLYASNAYCMKKLHAYSDFDDVKTFKDVQTIDAAVDFVRVMSRGTFSYSLLCNGELLEMEYMLNGLDDKDKENWAVVEKTVVNECIVNLSKIDKRDIELILSLE